MVDEPTALASPTSLDDGEGPPGDDHHHAAVDDRRRWSRPIALGLLIGLAVALAAFFIVRSDDERASVPAAPPVESSGATTAVDGVIDAAPPLDAAPLQTIAPVPSQPATATPPPDDPPPTTAVVVSGVAPASEGMVRVAGTEYPIERTCLTAPFAPDGGDYVVFSYLFADATGVPQIIEQWFMEGGATGASYSAGGFPVGVDYSYLGGNEFSVSLQRPDGPVEVVVNPPESGPAECGGTLATSDPATPDFAYTRTVVDACFGAEAGPLQYVAYLSDGGKLTATPNAGSGSTLRYAEPYVATFEDPDAALNGLPGGLEIRGTASSDGFAGAVTKDIVVTLRNDVIRTCTEHDTPL